MDDDDVSDYEGKMLLATPRKSQNLLPLPLATAVSLFTATSSLSLRLGTLVGNLAFSVGKITTLTGFEITRAILEGVLNRAGQYVLQLSHGQLGRKTAEGQLERALAALHQVITTSSFLVSAGFQIGSTSINTGLALGQSILSALDALFGDTETSKAIATIIILVQREVSGDVIGGDEEPVSLSEIFTSVVAFALLQRWGFRRTQLENEQTGAVETVWNIVVLADSTTQKCSQSSSDTGRHSRTHSVDFLRARPRSSASFISAHGDAADFEGTSLDDSRSFVSTASTRAQPDLYADGQIDHSLKDHITRQLKSGTAVKITGQSMTFNSITVEIEGDHDDAILDVPFGYTLVSSSNIGPHNRRLVYRNQVKKRKIAQFEVQGSNLLRRSSRHTNSSPLFTIEVNKELLPLSTLTPPELSSSSMPIDAHQQQSQTPVAQSFGQNHLPIRTTTSIGLPVEASMGRREANSSTSERLSKVKDTLKHRTSYRNLVDFWNNSQPKWRADKEGHSRKAPRTLSPSVSPSRVRGRSISRPTSEANTLAIPKVKRPTILSAYDCSTSCLGRNHKRERSAYSIVSATSENSVVLHSRPEDVGYDAVITMLNRTGRLPGQYPQAAFVSNAARYLRFATAAYGQSFLRILGTGNPTEHNVASSLSADPREHHAFSTYTRLPASTVLLSSYVDPEGVPVVKGKSGAATVLVHYVSLDHEAKAVVLTCRGSLGVEDILTDLTANYEDFYWQNEKHQVHQGILAAARKLLNSYNGRLMATLATSLEAFPDYGLVLCGHSLGGGVASVLAMLLSEPNLAYRTNEYAFVTKASSVDQSIWSNFEGIKSTASLTNNSPVFHLPAGRPVHVYAYGPAATMSLSLQRATRRLITSIIHGQDAISYLSLGSLRDFRSVALAFKFDQGLVKNEIRRRLWDGLQKSFRGCDGLHDQWLPSDALSEDQWPWLALQGLRSNLDADKLLPPGDVFHIDSKPVLQRQFVSEGLPEGSRTFKPAKHVTVTYVRDVESQFREIAFGPSMWFDHLPMRYEAVLETLEKGLA